MFGFNDYRDGFEPIETARGHNTTTDIVKALLEPRREKDEKNGEGNKSRGGHTGSGDGHDGDITNKHRPLGDDDLIRIAYPNTKVIFSEDFMSRSLNHYSFPPWLGRELIQNFIDANPDKGTLNGVEIDFSDQPNPTIKIRGYREFADPTALYFLDSSKGDSEDNAGGNGIGLKQVAFVMFMKYGIKDFIIKGRTRTVRYRLLSQKEINQKLKEKGRMDGDASTHQVKKSWFVAEVIDETNTQDSRKWNEYEIVFNPDDESSLRTYQSLRGMKNYGVHNDNPLLEGMSKSPSEGGFYTVDNGGFKILGNQSQQGAIFINGQRFQYNTMNTTTGKDDLSEDEAYWGGPLGMTLYITTGYDISIDRPALTSYNTSNTILYPLIRKLDINSKESILSETETIWKNLITKDGVTEYYNYRYWSGDTPLIEHLIYEIVCQISTYPEAKDKFRQKFLTPSDGVKILACDIKDPSKIAKLEKEGYTLVPKYFDELGVPYASSYLPPDSAPNFDHKTILTQTEAQARNHGVEVQYSEAISTYQLRTLDDIYAYLLQGFGKCNTLYDDNRKKLSIIFKDRIVNKKELFSSKSTRSMRDIRALFVLGFQNDAFDGFSLYYQGDRVTFTYHDGELFVRLQETDKYTDNLVIEVDSQNFSPDKIETRKKCKLTQKGEGDKAKNKKNANRNESGFLRRLSFSMVILCSLLGVRYCVDEIVKSLPKESPNTYHKPPSPLEEFRERYNQANVPNKSTIWEWWHNIKRDLLLHQLSDIHNAEIDDSVEDMVIIEMSDAEAKKFELLKKYVKITLGIEVKEECFIFEGKGAKGVNIGKTSIGLHTSMMKNGVDFFEVLKTFLHEMAHSNPSAESHDNVFRHTNEGLNIATLETYHDLVNAMRGGEKDTLTSDEDFIIHIEDYREALGE